MRSGVKSNWSRRSFLKGMFWIGIAGQFLYSCRQKANHIFLKLTGTNHILGHRLRFKDFPKVSETIEIPLLIIGGGVTGLSAAYQLKKYNIDDYMIVDMEHSFGGNSRSSKNNYSHYPLGAHYLPIPDSHQVDLLRFLEQSNIITHWDNDGTPIFDEKSLSFMPQSRLFIKNYWQEGIIPDYSLTVKDKDEIARFHQAMDGFSLLKGDDGRFVFMIPMQAASTSHSYVDLDRITMGDWMRKEGYQSSYLMWYVNYCCRDDFGLGLAHVSAFAGIHYFSSRKHDFKRYKDVVLTWSEGNAKLVNCLEKLIGNTRHVNHLVYNIKTTESGVEVYTYDALQDKSKLIRTKKVISCCPQFVNQHLISNRKLPSIFNYTPWIVATLVLKKFSFADGAPLSWDNVIFEGKGLGYIYDQHQSLSQYSSPFVITYYHSLDSYDVQKSRKQVYTWSDEQWKDFIIEDLSSVHFGIEEEIISIEIFRHGHGMISPVPGFITSKERRDMAKPKDDKVFFAHTDLSGLSLFEEAFYQGITVVDKIFKKK